MNIRLFTAILCLGLFFPFAGYAQCNFSIKGSPCVGDPLEFESNALGATDHLWDFNGEGSNNTDASPKFIFSIPGSKTITYSCKMPNGTRCTSVQVLVVHAKPQLRLRLLSRSSQCYENNQFCIHDSSLSGDGTNCIRSIKYLFSDEELITKYGTNRNPVQLPLTVCKSFLDPQGGDYKLKVEMEDCNGCIDTVTAPFVMKVPFLPPLFASSSALSDKCKGTVEMNFKNSSPISQSNILKFRWDFGDGTADSTHWDSIKHTYTVGNQMVKKYFPRLLVYTNLGCVRVYSLPDVAVYNIHPYIIGTKDSICSGNEICWDLYPKEMKTDLDIQDIQIAWFFDPGFANGYSNCQRFDRLGPIVIRCNVPHPCGPFELLDTITVIGPQAQYESPYMDPRRRYQCTIKDTVDVVDRSYFYHNDHDFTDDDSLYLEKPGMLGHAFSRQGSGPFRSLAPYDYDRDNDNIDRTWNFDDAYCQPCVTDRARNQNTWLNCKFSKDSMDRHWYTPWDSVYTYLFGKSYFKRGYFDPVLKKCDIQKVWASDSLYIIRDTSLFYGSGPLGYSARDSAVFKTMKDRHEIPAGQFGEGVLDAPYTMRLYIPKGSSIILDRKNGSPQFILSGPQYYMADKNLRIITSVSDSCYFIFGIDPHLDSVPPHLLNPGRGVVSRVKNPSIAAGDSVSPGLHRRLFYDVIPKCFSIALNLRDTVHPLRCQSEIRTAVALLPPSAKRLSIVGHFCDGYGNKVVNFSLSETRPGCMSSLAWFNPDYINMPDSWLLLNDLYYGDVVMGHYEHPGGKYRGYNSVGPNSTEFFWVYNDSVLGKKDPQSINVALIIGNGTDPEICSDTVYYHNFATFPRLDSTIVYAGTNKTVRHICEDSLVFVTTQGQENQNLLADESSWYMIDGSGDTTELIMEYYHKVASYYKYPGKKVNYTVIDKFVKDKKGLTLVKTDTIVTGIVHAYKAIALPGAGYNKLRERIALLGLNIDDFSDSTVLDLVWNGVGTIGQPGTGSKGCIDTTGFGYDLPHYYRISSETILHYKDTSLLPADSVKLGSSYYKAYGFTPKSKGLFGIYRSVTSYFPSYCPVGSHVGLAVGVYTRVLFSDSIICQGHVIEAEPLFSYYDLKNFGGLDTNDYWYTRRAEAGHKNREGITAWDFSKEDDDPSRPVTIFGGMPYAKFGYRDPAMLLGNEPNGIYYRKPGAYTLRVVAIDSTGCTDTVSQPVYVTGPKAGFYMDINTSNCKSILEFFDTSYIIDPCAVKGKDPCDFIYKWTIDWGDGSAPREFLKLLPKQVGHDYSINGRFTITLIVESILGCKDTATKEVYIPGPTPVFTPVSKITICVGDSVYFHNMTPQYSDSAQWLWSFGDGFFDPQEDTGTIYHRYTKTGMFDVYLSQFDNIPNTGKYCGAIYPDTTVPQKKITVTVLPYDNVKIAPNPVVVCVGDTLDVITALSTVNPYTQYNWTFDGNQYSTPASKLRISPNRKGRFMVTWAADTTGMNRQFCPDYDTTFFFADSVLADFTIDKSDEPTFCFTNLSKYAESYRWGFFHDTDITVRKLEFKTDETQKEPDHKICKNFIDHPGVNWVCLEATNALGCKDTVCRKLVNNFEMGILPPNVFTPETGDGFSGTDKDGLTGNEVFNIYCKNVEKYHLLIYDRWGVLVFESDNSAYDWNGRLNNNGVQCPDGTYYYLLTYRYKGRDKDEPILNGVVRLIR